MHFRINTDALVQALKLVQPGLLSHLRAGFSPVQVLAQPGRITLSTINDHGHFLAFVASEVEEEGTQVVYYQQLLDTVKPLHSMITVKSEQNNLIIASEGEHRHQAMVLGRSAEKLPDAPRDLPVKGSTFQQEASTTHTCETCQHHHIHKRMETYQVLENQSQYATVSKKRFVQMFDQVAWLACAWAYGDQKWQAGICIELSHDIFSLVGMRSPAGALASEPINGTWKRRVLVHAEDFRQVMRAIRSLPKKTQVAIEAVFTQFQHTLTNDEPVTDAPIQERAMILRLSADDFEVTLPLMSDVIPSDYQKDFRQQCPTRVVCQTVNLRSAIEAISPAAASHADIINLHIRDAKITVEVPDKQLSAEGSVPLVAVAGPDVSVAVNASYLLSMLKKLPVSHVALEFGECPEEQSALLRSCGIDVCVFRLETLASTQQK